LPDFNKNTFILFTTVIGFVLIPSFLAAWAEDEGNLTSDDMFWYFFARLFYILRFPTHTLFWSLIIKLDGWAFIAGLALNCMFYGLLFERLISYMKIIKTQKQ
jgi:cellulose synthase/poly-beta-1,6-N-acetylglucosamine synthase-like glycosyltransferase